MRRPRGRVGPVVPGRAGREAAAGPGLQLPGAAASHRAPAPLRSPAAVLLRARPGCAPRSAPGSGRAAAGGPASLRRLAVPARSVRTSSPARRRELSARWEALRFARGFFFFFFKRGLHWVTRARFYYATTNTSCSKNRTRAERAGVGSHPNK